jgi:phage terminase large subunit
MAHKVPATPAVFAPLWQSDKRFLGAYGGRGSAKSWDRASHMTFRMLQARIRCACVREVQNSIKDSVHQLLVGSITRNGWEHLFEITDKEIRARTTGSVAIFKGMKDANADNIKSLEGVDIAWWEEAQTASERSLRLLRPTIRKPGSQLWFTWNPRFKSDPVDKLFRQGGLTDSEMTLVKANYYDNPFFPDELELERQIDLRGHPANYAHVWEGDYEAESDTQFIGAGLVYTAFDRETFSAIDDPMILGVDVARFGDDSTTIYARRGFDARTMGYHRYEKLDTMQVAARVAALSAQYKADAVFIDEGGVGAGVVDRLRQMNVNCLGVNFGAGSDAKVQGMPSCANKRAEMWAKMREAIRSGLQLPDDDTLLQDLTGPLYSYNVRNEILLEKKEDMRKRGVKSPDVADALALTFAYPVTVGRAMREAELDRQADEYDPIYGSW